MSFSNLAIDLSDLLDVLVVSLALWAFLVWVRRSRARYALLGVAMAGVVYLLARLGSLELTAWMFQGFFAVLIVVLVVVFQDDLRRLFERIAVMGLGRRVEPPDDATADVIVRASSRMAARRMGALIVLPGAEPLDRHLEGGIALDGRVSEPLLLSLFDPGSPGHDGAVLIAGDRVVRFALHLPLSTNEAELGPGGTRHAAALGLAERSDCLCIVVSEERGTISVAQDGHIRVLTRPQELRTELQRFDAAHAPDSDRPRLFRAIAGYWREGLLAAGLAAALWAIRVPGASTGELTRSVPIVVEKLPSDYQLESIDPPEVQVTIRGLRRDLLLGASEPMEVPVDALLAKLGRRTFQLNPSSIRVPAELEVVSVEPDQVRISVTSPAPSE